MENKVLAWITDQALIPPGSTVICALSGGADSCAMLHILLRLREKLSVRVEAAHFNHRLRGSEADRDEAFCKELCASLCVPLHIGSADVRAFAEETGQSTEEAARTLRYRYLTSLGAVVATAHTADDNLETVLLNLIRGTGLAGLCGIPPKRDGLIRPILCLTREETEAYLRQNALRHIEDTTNADDECRRNRLRHHVLPLLRAENPSAAQTALRMGALLRQEDTFLNEQAEQALHAAQTPSGAYRCEALCSLPDALRGRAVRLLLQRIHAPKLSSSHIQGVEALLFSDAPSSQWDLPGFWRARREYDLLILEKAETPAEFSPVTLHPGERLSIPALGLCVRCTYQEKIKKICQTGSTFCCKCAMMDGSYSILIRPRQPGDALRLSGGTKSLKKLMIDRKIPLSRRPFIPVFSDREGIMAVGGIGVNLDRAARTGEAAVTITIEKEEPAYD